jgi:hypothetical protein
MSFTGGTGDIMPQYFTFDTGDAGAVDDYTVKQIALPVPRFGTMREKATIFEILSVDYYHNIVDTDSATAVISYLTTAPQHASADTATRTTMANDVAEPQTIAPVFTDRSLTTSGAAIRIQPFHVDTTDQNGNGILVATDKISIVNGSAGNTSVGRTTAKVMYRLVNVGVEEYIGIVQSQQS